MSTKVPLCNRLMMLHGLSGGHPHAVHLITKPPYSVRMLAARTALAALLLVVPAGADTGSPQPPWPISPGADSYVVTITERWMQSHNVHNSGGPAGIIRAASRLVDRAEAPERSVDHATGNPATARRRGCYLRR